MFYDYDEAVEFMDELKDKVRSMPKNAAPAVDSLIGIFNEHCPSNVRGMGLSPVGRDAIQCDSCECNEDNGYDGAIGVYWPCGTVQIIIDSFRN